MSSGKKDSGKNSKPESDLINMDENETGYYIKMAEHNLNFDPDDGQAPQLLNMALCFTACKWGQGQCGSMLLEHLLISLSESMVKPKYYIFIDSAIYLATENSVLESLCPLKKLEEAGAQILLSEASVSQYGQLSFLRVGKVVKFMEISNLLLKVDRFVNF